MDALHGPNVHVILSLKEGRGFGFLEQPLMIEASVNGHALGTHIISPAPEFLISVELMWEVTKKALRRFRTGNVPVKVESFTILNQEKHERIGYLLFNLRAAPIAVAGKTFQISGSWHPLLGVKSEYSTHHPELLLAVHIEDAVSETLSLTPASNATSAGNNFSHARHVFTPQLFEDEGIIQLGPRDTATDVFMLTIFVGEAVNLHQLADTVQPSVGDYWFSCNIMGFNMRAGSLRNLSSFSANNNEKVIVRIRSSLKILRAFFTDVSLITMHLMNGQQEIAFVDVDISVLVPTNDIATFCSQHAVNNTMAHINRCYLVKSSSGEVPVAPDCSRPYIDVVMKLKYMGGTHENAALAQGETQSTNSLTDQLIPVVNSENDKHVSPAFDEPNIINIKDNELKESNQHTVKYYFTTDIAIENILFFKIPPEKNILFRFGKKKGTITPTSYNEIQIEEIESIIPLHGINCKMKWECSMENPFEALLENPPIIWLHALADGKALPFACGTVDMQPLTEVQKNFHSTVRFRNPVSDLTYGEMLVSVTLKDPQLLCEEDDDLKLACSDSDVFLPVMDPEVSLKVVEELEEWKRKQEEIFKAELKNKEIIYLDNITAKWEMQQSDSETELKRNIEYCEKLAASLNATTEELRVKSRDLSHKEQELKQLEKTLLQQYTVKEQMLREASRRMQDDHQVQIAHLELEKKNLKEMLEKLVKENRDMANQLEQNGSRMEKMARNKLTDAQVTNLLQQLKQLEEQHLNAAKAKSFFRDQWLQAIREIHEMKGMHQQALQMQFTQKREELNFLVFQRGPNGLQPNLERYKKMLTYDWTDLMQQEKDDWRDLMDLEKESNQFSIMSASGDFQVHCKESASSAVVEFKELMTEGNAPPLEDCFPEENVRPLEDCFSKENGPPLEDGIPEQNVLPREDYVSEKNKDCLIDEKKVQYIIDRRHDLLKRCDNDITFMEIKELEAEARQLIQFSK